MTRAKQFSDRAGQFFIDGAWQDGKAARTLGLLLEGPLGEWEGLSNARL